MGRTKQSRPIKRRRVILEADDSVVAEEQTTLMEHQAHEDQDGVEGEIEMAKAIELLRKTPSHQLEAAAAEATRLDLARNDRWIHLRLPKTPSSQLPTSTSGIVFSECVSNQETKANSNDETGNDRSVPKKSLQVDASAGYEKATPDTVENASTDTAKSSAKFSSYIPSWGRGLGFARLGIEDFEALQQLHQLIKDRVNRKKSESNDVSSTSDLEWASWSGSIEDPRKRAFGFLPGTWGYDPEIRDDRLDITMPQTYVDDETRNDERIRNKRAMLVLEKSEMPKGTERAIKNLCQQFRESLLSKEKDYHAMTDSNENNDHEYRTRLAQFLQYEYMIAAQPNLHSGRALLPAHLDDPRKDGFGVVIVTIGMEGAGTILLRDAKGIHRGIAMRLERGDAYMLSDRARDACSHGVLADAFVTTTDDGPTKDSFSERESLNLRFGLHDLVPPCIEGTVPPVAVVPSSMVFRHWEE